MLTHVIFVARRLSVAGRQDKLKRTRAWRLPVTHFVLDPAEDFSRQDPGDPDDGGSILTFFLIPGLLVSGEAPLYVIDDPLNAVVHRIAIGIHLKLRRRGLLVGR